MSRRFDRAALERAAAGTLMGSHAPRLPADPLLGFDEVVELTSVGGPHGLGGVLAHKGVAGLDWVFACHFRDDPVVPGALLLDALLQLVGFYGGALGFAGRGRALRTGAVRFLREVTPAAGRLEYRITVRKVRHAAQIVVADGAVAVDGEPCLLVSDLAVAIVRAAEGDVRGAAAAGVLLPP